MHLIRNSASGLAVVNALSSKKWFVVRPYSIKLRSCLRSELQSSRLRETLKLRLRILVNVI